MSQTRHWLGSLSKGDSVTENCVSAGQSWLSPHTARHLPLRAAMSSVSTDLHGERGPEPALGVCRLSPDPMY